VTSAEREERPATHQYDFVVDLDSDNTHANVIRLVGEGRRVLELGPASGYMSEILRERGCTVVGVELDADMASQAARFCERVIVGDLDTLDLDEELGEDRFDVIVAADVLEHLKDPLQALRALRAFLRPEGYFVASLPNIAHASVRLALLEGRFDYRDLGLLDRTHLRFFTHQSIALLFDEAELAVLEIHRQDAPIDTTEIAVDLDAVPAEVLRELKRDPDASTYQFVIKAVPLAAPGMRELQSRLREQALGRDAAERELTLAKDAAERLAKDAAEREHALTAPRIRELEEALAAISGREGMIRMALIDAHDQTLRRDEQIDELNGKLRENVEELKRLRAEGVELRERRAADEAQLVARAEESRRLRVRLERILDSPPARMYARLGRLPLLRSVVRRRTAGYEQAVQDVRRSGA
jgi:2-polyprenyl-3-methyl-5-hydroxy-6-metoxy-1,4-benzoquinol methylase